MLHSRLSNNSQTGKASAFILEGLCFSLKVDLMFVMGFYFARVTSLCLLGRDVVSIPPHARRAYNVSRDVVLKLVYPTWRVFSDDPTQLHCCCLFIV